MLTTSSINGAHQNDDKSSKGYISNAITPIIGPAMKVAEADFLGNPSIFETSSIRQPQLAKIIANDK